MDKKKKNFTEIEKNLLTSVLVKYKDVIENKKTDGTSAKVKNETWKKIATEFNASQVINQQASDKQLQRLWINMKQRQREALAKERQHRMATGGGTAIKDAVIDPGVATVAPHLIVEIENVVDSDSFSLESNLPVIEADIIESIEVNNSVNYPREMPPVNNGSSVENSQNGNSSFKLKKIAQDITTLSDVFPPSPPNKVSRRDTSDTRSLSSAVSTKKDKLLQQEADIRMKREEQLILLDKMLYEQRIASEKENTRKLKAEAEFAELELQIRKRKAEEQWE